jgi:hypothetical protein
MNPNFLQVPIGKRIGFYVAQTVIVDTLPSANWEADWFFTSRKRSLSIRYQVPIGKRIGFLRRANGHCRYVIASSRGIAHGPT